MGASDPIERSAEEPISPDSGGSSDEEGETNTRYYFWGGIVSAIVSWLLLPIAGVVAVYCGRELYRSDRTTQGGVIAAVGGIGVLVWIGILAAAYL